MVGRSRLIDKKTKRERTILATSTVPDSITVSVGSGAVVGSDGGSHIIDGHVHQGAHNGHGLLLDDILDYAQRLESEDP